jgi:hypothetical protein
MLTSRPTVTFLLAISAFSGAFAQARAATITAKSVSLDDVSSAVRSAKDGDTVEVPPGKATWVGGLTITNAITLRGAGIGKTIILDNLPVDGNIITINTNHGKSYRLTGFELGDGSSRPREFGKGCIRVTGDTKAFRLDHCKFNVVLSRCIFFKGFVL